MQPIPYVFYDGHCAEALEAYAKIFEAPAPEMMRVRDSPMAEEMPGKGAMVMHGSVRIGEGWLYASDDITGDPQAMAGCSIAVSLPTVEAARRVFDALAEGGTVRMPFEATFWSAGFGMLSDRWGIRWMVMTDEGGAG